MRDLAVVSTRMNDERHLDEVAARSMRDLAVVSTAAMTW